MDGRKDRALLLRTARAAAAELKLRRRGTTLRVRVPARVKQQDTGGWSVTIGSLGKGEPRMEIWLDRFTGHRTRKFYFGLYSHEFRAVEDIAKRAARKLRPNIYLADEDLSKKGFWRLTKRLRRHEFDVSIRESYWGTNHFFGVFDSAPLPMHGAVNFHLCARISAFFEAMARVMPGARADRADAEAYPHFENRQRVASHLQRERSVLLATERKVKDDYVCQVCDMRFEKTYGTLGRAFAEAHHLVPLSRLSGRVRTRIDDLRTVCANCHRMLHKMAGVRSDIAKLRLIWRRNRSR